MLSMFANVSNTNNGVLQCQLALILNLTLTLCKADIMECCGITDADMY